MRVSVSPILLAAVSVIGAAACSVPGTLGVDALGGGVYLSVDGRRAPAGSARAVVADAAAVVDEGFVLAAAREELVPLLEERGLRLEQVRLEYVAGSIDSAGLGEGGMSYFATASLLDDYRPPTMERGQRMVIRVAAAVAVSPRTLEADARAAQRSGEPAADRSHQLVFTQVEIDWYAGRDVTGFSVADRLATALRGRIADEVLRWATAQGLGGTADPDKASSLSWR